MAARYPGDLAADVAGAVASGPARGARFWTLLVGAGSFAAAAAVTLAVARFAFKPGEAPPPVPREIARQPQPTGRPVEAGRYDGDRLASSAPVGPGDLTPDVPAGRVPPVLTSSPRLPGVRLGALPGRAGVVPSVGRIAPPMPAGMAGIGLPPLGGPRRGAAPAGPSTQESV